MEMHDSCIIHRTGFIYLLIGHFLYPYQVLQFISSVITYIYIALVSSYFYSITHYNSLQMFVCSCALQF